MKLNKYRWREMKDEKPDIDELVIVKYASQMPFIAYYLGLSHPDICRWELSLEVECITNEEETKWRKMCKLPGDK